MVHEVRRIMLNKHELFNAIECHRRMVPSFLPEGQIIDFEVLSSSSLMITVETEPSMHEASVVFTDDKLLLALIRFCIENNIMLPRQGKKSISIAQDDVSLCIDLQLDVQLGEAPAFLQQAMAG